jgi:hypothetical protein
MTKLEAVQTAAPIVALVSIAAGIAQTAIIPTMPSLQNHVYPAPFLSLVYFNQPLSFAADVVQEYKILNHKTKRY